MRHCVDARHVLVGQECADLPNPFSPGPYAECESAATEMAEMPTMVPKFSGSARLWGAA